MQHSAFPSPSCKPITNSIIPWLHSSSTVTSASSLYYLSRASSALQDGWGLLIGGSLNRIHAMGKRKRRETNLSVETGPLNVSHHAASGSVLLSPPSSGAGPLTGKEDTTTSTSKKTKRRKKKSRRTREEGETADPEASDGFRKSSAGPTGLQMSSPEALRLDNAASSHVGGDSPGTIQISPMGRIHA